MKKLLFLVCALALAAAGCGSKPAANAPASSSPAKPASSNSTASTSPKAEKKAPSTNPVPADWIRMYDDGKGYEFMVPDGTKHDWRTVDGVDVYRADVPAPYEIGIIVVAFKDKTLTKDDLLQRAQNILKNMGEKDIKIDPAKELNADYSLASCSSVDEKGKTTKAKILVGTDITDNYIMLVGIPAEKFDANEKTIDEIWGSFGMYSGGYSGNS